MTAETKSVLLGWVIIVGAYALGNNHGYKKGESDTYNKINKTMQAVAESVSKKTEQVNS